MTRRARLVLSSAIAGPVIGLLAAGVAFEHQYHIPYPRISDPDDLIAARFGAAAPVATPATYILDGRGRIAWAYFGATTYVQLELAVTEVARL